MSGKYALIIGTTEYTDPKLPPLTAPIKDAEDFAQILKDPDICSFDEVNILLNQPSSFVIEAIDEFFDQKKPDDMLVLYFSGHGIKDDLGSLYLAFKNTIRTRLRATAIKSDYIREAMDQSRSKRQVLILDCCNSGAFPPGTKAELGGSMGMTKAFQGYGRFVLTASDATQFAWEGDQVIGETENSLFTHFLVKGLKGEADSDGDGRITVDELYDYAYDQISKVTPKQTPTKSAAKVEGEIILRQNMRIEDIKPIALSDDLIGELEDIRPLVREGAVQTLERILNGRNIGLRRSAIKALEKIVSDENTTRRVSQLATQALEAYHQVEKKAEEERKAKEEAERIAILKAEEERLARDRAEADRKAKEEAERLALAKAQQEAAEREAMRLKAEREATEIAAREAAEKVAKEKAEKEIVEREAARLAAESEAAREKAEHTAALKAEREAAKLAARKKAEREAAQKAENEAMELAARRKAEREAKEKVPVVKTNLPSWIKFGVIGGIIIAIFWGGFTGWKLLTESPIATPAPSQLPATQLSFATIAPTEKAIATTKLIKGNVTIWHAYGADTAEGVAFIKLIEQAKTDFPNVTINVLQIPFNDIYNKYRTDVAAGGGPDMFIAPNDSLGYDARAGSIADITDLAAGKLDGFSKLGIDGMTVAGKLFGIPESLKAVTFWYNKDLLATPPATTDDLQALMEKGMPIGMVYNCYHTYGFYSAFGGNIFDANWKFVADQGTGVVDTFTYLNNLYQISKRNGWATNDSDGLIPFTEGKLAAIINGNWAMSDYRRALGDKLAVAPLPAGPAGSATPLLGVDGFYFNPNSNNKEAALEVALYLTSPASQTKMMEEAGHVPVRTTIFSDSLIRDLMNAFNKGTTIRPQVPEMDKYWLNFCSSDQIYEQGVSPTQFVKDAVQAANK